VRQARLNIPDTRVLDVVTLEDATGRNAAELNIRSLSLLRSEWMQDGAWTIDETYLVDQSTVNHNAAFTVPGGSTQNIINGSTEVLNLSYDSWQDVVVDGATLVLNAPQTWTSLELRNGAVLTHSAAASDTATGPVIDLTVDTLSVDASSVIDVSHKGRLRSGFYAGGSHGGQGGVQGSTSASYQTNETYGSLREPVDLGTGLRDAR